MSHLILLARHNRGLPPTLLAVKFGGLIMLLFLITSKFFLPWHHIEFAPGLFDDEEWMLWAPTQQLIFVLGGVWTGASIAFYYFLVRLGRKE
jgi:hypothetical protein